MTKANLAGAVAATLGLACTGASCAKAAGDPAYDRCVAASGGVMPAIKACGVRQQQSKDSGLNQSYARALHATPVRNQAALRAAERAWVAFRDAECGFRYTSEGGGQDALLVASQCQAELANARIAQLDAYAPPRR